MLLAYLRRSLASKPLSPLVSASAAELAVSLPAAARGRNTPLWALIALSAIACAKQGEGERCDLLSGGEDCETGLMCVSLDDRNQGVGAVCCPSEGDSNTAICKGNSVNLGSDAGDDTSNNSDAGNADAGGPDAAATDQSSTDSNSTTVTADTDAAISDASASDDTTNDAGALSDASTDSSTTSDITNATSSIDTSGTTDSSSTSSGSDPTTSTEESATSDVSSSETPSDAGGDGSADAG